MIIKVYEVKNRVQQYQGCMTNDFLELNGDVTVIPTGDIFYDFRAERIEREIFVKGNIKGSFKFICRRCNGKFDKIIDVLFIRTYNFSSESDVIDLTNDVREDILLALPSYWLCSEDCKGLCPECGVNLNEEKCTCKKRDFNDVWSILNKIKIK